MSKFPLLALLVVFSVSANESPPTSPVPTPTNEIILDLQSEDPYVQNNLGWKYESGNGVPRNDSEAVKWFRKSAEQGNPYGQFNLGWMYENGRGIPHDLAQARQWYQRAAAQGLGYAQEAMLRLGQQ